MSRTAARFTQADLNRAVRAAKQAGAQAVVLTPDGAIRIELANDATELKSVQPEDRPIL